MMSYVVVCCRQSPHLSRRLSTLVEEGSDAEADESIISPKSPRSPHAKAVAAMLGVSHAGRRTTPQLLEVPHGSQSTIQDRPKTPPSYKAPPAYPADHSPRRQTK